MSITVHIERLIVDASVVEPQHALHLQAAVQQELLRLLSDGRLPATFLSGGSLPLLNGGFIQPGEGAGAGEVGRQIAAAVHSGFGWRR
jgi:hypothetical protein